MNRRLLKDLRLRYRTALETWEEHRQRSAVRRASGYPLTPQETAEEAEAVRKLAAARREYLDAITTMRRSR